MSDPVPKLFHFEQVLLISALQERDFPNHRLCATVSSCNVVHAPVHENRSTWGTPSSKNPLNEVCYPCYAVCVKPIITYGFESTKQGGNLMFAAHCPTQRAAFITDMSLHIPAI